MHRWLSTTVREKFRLKNSEAVVQMLDMYLHNVKTGYRYTERQSLKF